MRDEFGTTFVFSTHDPRIMGEAEVIFTLEDGRIATAPREGRAREASSTMALAHA